MSLLFNNLNLMRMGAKYVGSIEFPIFSSTDFTHGDHEYIQPLTIFNNIGDENICSDKLYVRLSLYGFEGDSIGYIRQYIDKNTSFNIQHEVAALLSLHCGCPAYAGAITRDFPSEGGGGYPYRVAQHPPPRFVDRYMGIIPPRYAGVEGFTDFVKNKFLALENVKANYFIRACISYQKALWISDLDPNLSFLLLCSSIEALANYNKNDPDYDYKLVDYEPELYSRLKDIGDEKFEYLSAHLEKTSRSTKKFVEFLIKHATDVNGDGGFDPAKTKLIRSKANIKAVATKIYKYRSKSLHESISFPHPMMAKPRKFNKLSREEKYIEIIDIIPSLWNKKDLPIYLQTFAELTRNAMLSWMEKNIASPSS